MAKISYTWFPKDWNNSESVFELDLQHRGLYRELIDLAMLQDNKVIINRSVWCRKWMVCDTTLSSMLNVLYKAQLIDLKEGGKLFIPSCETRLSLVRRGSKGGSTSKPTPKPITKPTPKQSKVKQKKVKEIPSEETFMIYLKDKLNEQQYMEVRDKLILRYKSWAVNDWKDGYGTPIQNWKNKGYNAAIQLIK
jgi:hypothetical protein